MEVKVNIPFRELMTVIKQLSPTQKAILHKELANEAKPATKKSRLTELLLKGPRLSG